MTWFRSLHQIAEADPSSVGYNAYCLRQLRQHGLPIADSWVLSHPLWQQMLEQITWPHAEYFQDLTTIRGYRSEALSDLSSAWQTCFSEAFDNASWLSTHLSCPLPQWVMRPSLWLAPQPGPQSAWPHPLHELLTDFIGSGSGDPLVEALRQFWRQAFQAGNLLIWGRHCRTLQHVNPGVLIQALYPAQVSGRLTLVAGRAYIEAIEGLIFPLTRGEAIPARCQVNLAAPGQAKWQPGYQEQVHHLVLDRSGTNTSRVDPSDQPLSSTKTDDKLHPTLDSPLTPDQLGSLLQLAEQVEAILTEAWLELDVPGLEIDRSDSARQGVRIEWALYPCAQEEAEEWVITRAMPWSEGEPSSPGSQSAPTAATLPPPVQPPASPSPQPPPLPQVSVVVKGIGASFGQVQAPAIVAQTPQDLPNPLPPGVIVVLPDLQPDQFLRLESVAGIVIEQGGATCHAAILARELELPAVVGAPHATQLIDSDLMLWLDGDQGLVYGMAQEIGLAPATTNPDPAPPAASTAPRAPAQGRPLQALRTKVMVNLSQARRVKDLPLDRLDGVGLLRSEWLMLDILDQRHPWHWINQGQAPELQARLTEALQPILQTLGSKPLRYRSLDLRSHEWQSLAGSPPVDTNPMLGLRGTLSYTIDSRLFEVELGALATLQQLGHTNLQLMLPFVRSVEEVIACRQYIQYAGLSQQDGFALWIMAEVPSVLFLLPAYAKAGIQGIAIGSNDLTQLLLAVDRDQSTMASAYDERHPVVRMALAYLVQEAKRCGMVCSICGQAPVRHPELIKDLVSWGIDSISVELGALEFTRTAIWQAEQ